MQKPGGKDEKLQVEDCTYEKRVNLSIPWNRWLLKPTGLWPDKSYVSPIEKNIARLVNTVCYGLIGYLVIPCSLYVFLDVENIFKEIELFGIFAFCVAALWKYHSLILHGDDIRTCVEHMKYDWKNITHEEDKEIMALNASFGKRIVTICAFFMYTGFTFYFLVVPISADKMVAEDLNVTFRQMVVPVSRFIVDVRYSPVNEIFFLIQIIAGVLIHAIAVVACSLAAVFAVHACGQMGILMSWLEHLIDGREDMSKNVDDRIAVIVNQHVRILKFLELVEKALRQVSFAELLVCTVNLCLVGYYIITEWNSNNLTTTVTYVVLYISLTFNIFIFCYIGELVSEQCKKVGEVSYMIEWYRLPGNKKLCCILIMAMSNSSVKFTAGNMVELSISTFSSVVRTSVAFLNALRTFS
ncbi:PREDICTED: uncharacterized protein LOC108577303 [Habropoda laboriosa]|uniref:uncharacterized protein LOC108577303 n=1 Tax=Habropoda laboriosa TaxID=597456 RepID=UPI00083D1B90|nr:PREDICTED: uncharacterized protein LOC108577303 [Habropoda laboriosa]